MEYREFIERTKIIYHKAILFQRR